MQMRKDSAASMDTIRTYSSYGRAEGSDQPKPAPGVNPPETAEPYFVLPTEYFSLHHHLVFNPAPEGPICNCGTWQIWCLPPHLGGCGHVYVQDRLYCGRTIDEDEIVTARATACPGVVMRRTIRSAAVIMGLCPSCRCDRGVVQKGLPPMKAMDAEQAAAATWRAHRLAFAAWVGKNRQERIIH